ncbi:hypothetical protein BJV78DRAFT_1283432 [Lactifluus subvellereus]|nr:hypothetical protein BJV78DRAFT_1283432 [Lactifluus subvellereus]
MKYCSICVLASVIKALARPAQDVLVLSNPRPLGIWHGLGKFVVVPRDLRDRNWDFRRCIPDIHAVYINPDSKEDQRATFVPASCSPKPEQFGKVDEQVELVA